MNSISTVKRSSLMAAFALVLGLTFAQAAQAREPDLAAVLAGGDRPADERAQDAARKPVDVLGFMGVKSGDVVIERFPGNVYYTRLLSKIIGPTGKLYVMLFKFDDGKILDIEKIKPLADASSNIVLVPNTNALPQARAPVDVVISLQNYHDLHVGKTADTAAPEMNRLAYQVLKPGGRFVVIDHVAPPGAGATLAPKTHRIEMSTARAEVEAAGFKFAGASEALRNPDDPRTATVSDPSIAGHTDRFMMAFTKPR